MELRLRLLLISLMALIAVAVWTFPAWRGFFRQTESTGAFPGLALELQEDFLSLPADQRRTLLELRETSPETALGMALVAIGEAEPAPESETTLADVANARIVASGSFITIDALHWGEGSATIYEFSDRRILRFEDFRSSLGGDPRVYLARDPQPGNALELGEDYLDLGRLKGNIGSQHYILLDDLDLSVYQSAVIYCRRFETVITSARLR